MERLTFLKDHEGYRGGYPVPMVEVNNGVDVDCIEDRQDDYTLSFCNSLSISRIALPPRRFVAGPIVDKLYKYEQLGFDPDELYKIVQEHKQMKAEEDRINELVKNSIKNTIHGMHITTARGNGKYELQKAAYKLMVNSLYGSVGATVNLYDRLNLEIKDVIFNDPATIVFWLDGTKTVVKAQKGEKFDPEKGLMAAITKKALGNEGKYYNKIGKWVKKYIKPVKKGGKKK